MAKVDHLQIRTFVENKNGQFAEMANLPFWWDSIDPSERDPEFPNYTRRHILLSSYSNWAFMKRWAWDGMQQLLIVLLEHREPIPEALQCWAYSVAIGTWSRPRKTKNAERNARMMHTLRSLKYEMELSKEEAIAEIAVALRLSEGTVRSAVDVVRDARPFQKST